MQIIDRSFYKIENTIADHLTEEDFLGTIADLEGNPIERRVGGFFNHKQEMIDSLRSLKNATGSLKKSLKNSNLAETEKQVICTAINKGIEEIARIENFHCWGFPEEKDEYLDLLKKLKKTINSK